MTATMTKKVRADDQNRYARDKLGWASDMRERFHELAPPRPLTQSITRVIGAAKDFAISRALSPATLKLQQSSVIQTAFIVSSSPPPPASRSEASTADLSGTIEAAGRFSKLRGRLT